MSSPVEAGQEVISAQGQIVSHCFKRYGIRIAFVFAALVFLGFSAVSFHGVLWALFLTYCHLGAFYSSLCVLGVDFFFVLLFAILASLSRKPGLSEEKARMHRDRKLQELKQSLALSTVFSVVTGPVGRYAGGRAFKFVRSLFSRH